MAGLSDLPSVHADAVRRVIFDWRLGSELGGRENPPRNTASVSRTPRFSYQSVAAVRMNTSKECSYSLGINNRIPRSDALLGQRAQTSLLTIARF
jgi:hypothetical protein